ncbi:MAG: DUF934 domain-containing protein [Myxococcales bacterium]|nr:DUF934 domain-containing protein [Myxococcales bacterium]
MELIKRGVVVEDGFKRVADDGELSSGDVLVSWARLQAEAASLLARSGRVGVRVPNDVDLEALAPYVEQLDLIAIEFPTYTDGRGYSLARRLRERHGFRGELRAVGDVLRDQLFYMRRCGFDAFELKEGKDVAGALEAFREFSVTYQGAADDPRPLFRRRGG